MIKNKFVLITLVSLLFLGCTKVITVGEEPVRSYETTSSSNNAGYEETQSFNISPLQAFDKMQENQNVLLLDVRMPNEIPQYGKIANSMMIPLQVLGSNLHRLDKSKEIIVYCHTGNRSVEATQLLRREGFNAINMTGGIEAWKRNHLSVRWK